MGRFAFFPEKKQGVRGRKKPPAMWPEPRTQGWPFRASKIKSMVSLLLNVSGLPPIQRPGTRNFLCDCSLIKWITGQSWILTHELKTKNPPVTRGQGKRGGKSHEPSLLPSLY